jgi:glycosyltransferase involved in cell wall biosynthesis
VDEKGLWHQVKILFIQETDWLKRGPHQQHHLADRLSVRGHTVAVIDHEFTWRSDGKKELFSRRQVFRNIHKVDERANVTVIRPGILKIPLLDYLSLFVSHRREIERQIKEFSPDVIVGYGIVNSYLASKAARRLGIPFVYYWIDVLHRLIPVRAFQPLGKMFEKSTLEKADRILAINETLGEYTAGLGAPTGRIRLLKAGIDISKFDLRLNGREIRQKYHIAEEDIVIFFMGWLYHFSGLKEAAIKLASVGNKNLKLLIVGEGDAFNDLKKIQETYGLQDKLILAGKKPYQEIPGYIAAADICLLPAYPDEPIMQDIVPIKLYEYLAMMKPVISTRLPGVLKEFGLDNGVLYVDRPEDVVAAAIELSSGGKIREIGKKGRMFAEKNNWDNLTLDFEKILQEVIQEKRL